MQIFRAVEQLKEHLSSLYKAGRTVGFVPTMGALHDGHLELVGRAIQENDYSICSIFVNPTQFNNPTDLVHYPRQEEQDIEKLRAKGCSFVFIPSVEEMYPEQVEAKSFDFGGVEKEMEGAFRPGHFDGVGTVVGRLFDIVEPTRAYFGEKDFQQLRIIQKLVELEGRDIEIVPCPIVREKSGLAMSSRNQRLSLSAREDALILYRILTGLKQKFKEGVSWGVAYQEAIDEWNANQLGELEYLSLNSEEDLSPQDQWGSKQKQRLFIAAEINGVRLIDNLSIN